MRIQSFRSVPTLGGLAAWLFLLCASNASADVAIGAEYWDLNRSQGSEGSQPADSVFLGFDVGNSMFYLRFQREEDIEGLQGLRERSDLSASWHWNESIKKGNFLNTNITIRTLSYGTANDSADFLSLMVGGGGTRFLTARSFYITALVRVGTVLADRDDLFSFRNSDPEVDNFFAYDAKAALGVIVGSKKNFTIQAGYKFERIDYQDRFFEDEAGGFFLAGRLFIGSD